MSMLYSFVARGSVVLAKYAACQGNFEQVAIDCLEKLSGTESRFTIKAQDHMLHFLVDSGLTYLLVAEENCSREICFYYLEQVCIFRDGSVRDFAADSLLSASKLE
jgi:Regulated-SNARE-like domain